MEIDWFTVVAQVINFLILVWLLKKFLYKPILDAIKDRENQVTAQLSKAKEEKEAALKARTAFEQKNENWQKEHNILVSNATEELNKERTKQLEEIRKECEQVRMSFETNLEQQKKEVALDFMQKAQGQIFDSLRKLLQTIASASLEEQIIAVFVQRLRHLEGSEKEQMISSLNKGKEPLLVSTTFTLSPSQKESLEKTLLEVFGESLVCKYEVSAIQLGGITLSARDYKISWTMQDYLDELSKNAMNWLKEKSIAVA